VFSRPQSYMLSKCRSRSEGPYPDCTKKAYCYFGALVSITRIVLSAGAAENLGQYGNYVDRKQ
jgi:hypothetical protein